MLYSTIAICLPSFLCTSKFLPDKGEMPAVPYRRKWPLGAEHTTRAAPVVDVVDLGARPLLGPKTFPSLDCRGT